MLRFRRLSTTSSKKTHRPEPLLRHPRKGVAQPRPRTPSTVSTDRLLSPAFRSAVHSELNTTTLRTPFRSDFGHGPRQRGFVHGGLELAWGLDTPPCDVACSFTRDAYDRFLPSAASISSTRASFVLDEVAPRPNGILSVPPKAARPEGVASRRTNDRAPSGFTPPWWLWWVDAFAFASRSNRGGLLFHHGRRRPTQYRACHTVSMRRLANPFAVAHASRQHLDRLLAGPVKASPPHDQTRLPSKGAFHLPTPCDACRVWGGTWSAPTRSRLALLVLPPAGLALRPFTATMPCCFGQTRLSRLGPRSRPRI
jgi:hypothetical protein